MSEMHPIIAKSEVTRRILKKFHLRASHRLGQNFLIDPDIVNQISNNLNGSSDSSKNRAVVGKILGIGYANSKIFLQRLNNYGISREEFDECLKSIQ